MYERGATEKKRKPHDYEVKLRVPRFMAHGQHAAWETAGYGMLALTID